MIQAEPYSKIWLKKNAFWIMLAVFLIFLLSIYFNNQPFDPEDFWNIIWQVLSIGVFAGLTWWIADGKMKSWRRAIEIIFVTSTVIIFWYIMSPLKSEEKISCYTDVEIFKDGSGNILSLKNFALIDEKQSFNAGLLNEELSGYDQITTTKKSSEADSKEGSISDEKILASATFAWMHETELDWSNCKPEPFFEGVSFISQKNDCSTKSDEREINLGDNNILGETGMTRIFSIPSKAIMIITKKEDELLINISDSHFQIAFSFSKWLSPEIFGPHIEGSKPLTVADNIARMYKPKKILAQGMRMSFSFETNKMRRWSELSKDNQRRATLFCSEYDKAFSWPSLKEKLESVWQLQS